MIGTSYIIAVVSIWAAKITYLQHFPSKYSYGRMRIMAFKIYFPHPLPQSSEEFLRIGTERLVGIFVKKTCRIPTFHEKAKIKPKIRKKPNGKIRKPTTLKKSQI